MSNVIEPRFIQIVWKAVNPKGDEETGYVDCGIHRLNGVIDKLRRDVESRGFVRLILDMAL